MSNVDGEKCFVAKIPQTYYGLLSVEDYKLFLSSNMATFVDNPTLEVDHGIIFLE